ncbi:hypothetical protein, partial [Yersinia pekkanenii]
QADAPLSLKTPEERAQEQAEKDEARRQSLSPTQAEKNDVPPEMADAERQLARAFQQEQQTGTLHQQQHTEQAVNLERQHNQQQALQQLEREIVKEKTLGE